MPAVRALAPVRAGRQRALYAAIAVVPAAHAHDQQLQPALGLKDVRPSKQPLMVRTFLKVYMELGSYFLFLQEQIKDILIKSSRTEEHSRVYKSTQTHARGLCHSAVHELNRALHTCLHAGLAQRPVILPEA